MILLYAASYFQRTSLPGTIYNTLAGELSLDAKQMANLSASFVYPYALFQLVSGSMADRFGGARVVVVGGLIFCAGIIIFPLCSNLYVLYFARMLTGIGASAMYLSLVRETDRLFGRKNYSLFLGIVYFCGYAGGLLGSLPFERLCHIFHWRDILLTAAIISTLLYLVFLFGKSKVEMPPIPDNKFSIKPFLSILCNPLSMMVTFCANVNFCTYFIIQTVFGKKFLEDFAHLSSGAAAAVIFALSLVCVFTIMTSSLLTRFSGNRRRPLILCASGICMASAIFMTLSIRFDAPAWCFAVIYCMFAAAAGIPPIFAMSMQEVNSKDIMAQSAATVNMFSYLSVAVSSQLIGWLLDSFDKGQLNGTETYSPQAYQTLFIIVSVITVISFGVALKIPETKGHYLHLQMKS